MGLFEFFKKKEHNSSQFKNSVEAKQLLVQIERHNKKLEIQKEEYFDNEGKAYRYFYENGMVRAEGSYFYLGHDKKGEIVDEKFQGKNVEYYEDGRIKEIVFYKDGIPTGDTHYYNENENEQ